MKLLKKNKVAITPTVLQMEAVECGAAALGIILGYYGKFVALEELRENTGVSRDGVNAANIIKAAEKYNLTAEGIAIELPEEQGTENNLAELNELTFPCIVFWEFNHFLVIEGVKGQKIYLNDPASGRKSIEYKDFNHSFTGIVLEFTPNKNFKKGGEKTRLLPGLIKRLQGSLDSLILAICISFLLIIPGILIPGFTKVFIDNILVQQLQGWIKPLLLGMFLTLLLHMLLTWMQQKTLIQLSAKLGITASAKFLWHVFHLPIAFFDQRYVGDINNRIQANDRVALLLSGDISTAMVSLFAVGFYAAVMLLLNTYLALIAIGFSLLNILVLNFFSRKLSDQSRKLSQESGRLHGVTMNGLQIIETLKTESLENIFFMRWAGFHAKKMHTEQKFELYSQLVITLPPLITSLTTITTLLLGTIFIIEGTLSIGSLIALQSLILLFDKPMITLVNSTVSLKEAEGDLARMDDVLNYKKDQSFSQPKKKFKNQKKRLNGKITLSNITYGYNKLEPPLIENLSITLNPSSQLALVGPSGSGKSTLAKIIAGIYTPWQGEVCFDDVPISEIPDEILKKTLGVVNQEIYLFAGTVRDNITLWDDTVSSHSLLRACQDAYIEAVIKERPERFEAQVTEGGANFSQGQRQRLEIARALIHDPNILILDEAFSALDPHVEKLIDNNIKRRECTSIIVAHRLSSIRDCDEILVLDKGKIIERGTHKEMLKNKGFYSKLIKSEKLA